VPLVLVLDDDRRVPINRALSVGADKGCDVVLAGLAAKHARLEPGDEWTVVRAEGKSEVTVNEVAVADGETRALLPGDRILFGPARAKVAYEETNVPMKTAELALAALNRVRAVPRIVVVSGGATGAHHDLTIEGAPIRLGRGRDCDWTIEDEKLSRAHVRFVLRAGHVLVRDLESARGTFMGTARLEPQKDAPWKPGVSLRAGGLVLTLVGTIELDAALAEVAEHAELPVEPLKVVEPEPIPAQRSSSPAAMPAAGAPIASPPTPAKAPVADGHQLRVRIVIAIGAMFIAGCVAALLWVLGVFSR
jgi:hypothetical protein